MSKHSRNTLFKYFTSNHPSQEETNQDVEVESEDVNVQSRALPISKQPSKYKRIDLSSLPSDPGLRRKITDYHPDDQIEIRKHYVLEEPFQPRQHNFRQTLIGGLKRRFNPDWYDTYGDWLKYSILKDDVFCRYCYLFKSDISQKGGGDAFVTIGWSSWNKSDRLGIHVGETGSYHNQAYIMFEALKIKETSIKDVLHEYTEQEKEDYRGLLEATVECIRWLLQMGLAFRGHNESKDSKSRGNFIELLMFLANNNEDNDKVVLDNAPKNLQLTCPVDESRDISIKEKMTIVLRYVDKRGIVIEWFLGITHVPDTTALTLKAAIDFLLSQNGLSVSRIREQASCKRRDILRAKRADEVKDGICIGAFQSGRGLHQETSLQRPADTRWSSQYRTLLNLLVMLNLLVDTLEYIDEEGIEVDHRGEARIMKKLVETFDFVFPLHLMLSLLGITNDLSLALQRKDEDIVNAMDLVHTTRQRLQVIRDEGWESMINGVSSFCEARDISVLNMDDLFVLEGRSKRKAPKITFFHRYRAEIFFATIDFLLQEINSRFNEGTT
ncbi:uncharacterized protein [Spinacia oleracea]|uniref:TTF-type domain-containing protein n=1 Tax=Spinacia oleracea TaxID=3562 RepID=A0ABM3R0R7_SPIOL|nr:uncharacterized protein LOC110791549 [Spinacia oleracea]